MFGSSNTGSTGFSFGQQSTPQQNQGQQTGSSLFGQTPAGQTSFGFGGSTTPAFGQQNTGTSLFGQSAQQPQQQQQPANTGFGSFGASTSTTPAFGQSAARPAFGSTGGVFGAQTSTPAPSGGLFGSTSTAPSSFGQNNAFSQPQNATTGLFGSRPATTGFGTPASNTGGGLFGSTNTASTSAFGQPANNSMMQQTPAAGTSQPTYQATSERDPTTNTVQLFQSITCMPAYKNFSFEELRLLDYQQGRKVANAGGSSGVFGASTSFGTGNTTSTTPFGQNSSSTFGQPAQQSSSGLFGQSNNQPSSGLFGQSNPNPFGSNSSNAFGQPAQSNAFGGTSSTGLFGSNQQPSSSTGLFGSNPSQPSSTGLFGNTSQPQQPSTGLFGQASTPAPSTGLFGQNQQNKAPTFGFGQSTSSTPAFGQPTTSTGGFGTTPAPASSGGLFGQSTPAPSGGFSFGQSTSQAPATGGLFGSDPNKQNNPFGNTSAPSLGGSSLFGQNNQQNQNKPLFGGFGTTPSTTQNQNQNQNQGTSFTGFGQTPTSGAGGLFGSTSSAPTSSAPTGGLFGATQTPSQPSFGLGSGGSSLFGRPNPTATTGTFGQSASQPNTGSSLFGNASSGNSLFSNTANPGGGFSTSSGFGASTFGQNQPQNQAGMQATVDQNAYGQNPLFNSNAAPALAVPIEQPQVKPPIMPLINSRVGTPRSAARLRPRNLMSPSINGLENPVPWALSGSKPGTPKIGQLTDKSDGSSSLFSGLSNASLLGANAFSPRNSVKKLIINKKVRDVDIANITAAAGSASPSQNGKLAPSALKARVNFDSSIETSDSFGSTVSNVGSPFAARSIRQSVAETPSPSPHKDFGTPLTNKMAPSTQKNGQAPGEDLEKGEYWIEPSIDELIKLDAEQLSNVEDFVVGRKGYGKIAWKMPVDLNDLDFAEIAGQVVQIEERMTAVYEDNPRKPPRGEGLNVPATITLEACWPLDKATREPIKDESHPKVRHHVTKLKTMNGTRFVNYDVSSGQWTFDVEHFSRYGLAESDDESENESSVPEQRSSQGQAEDHDRMAGIPSISTPRTLQFVRRPLRREGDRNVLTPFDASAIQLESSPKSLQSDTVVLKNIGADSKVPPTKKRVVEFRRRHEIPTFPGVKATASVIAGESKSTVDAAVFLGRSHRPGWGPRLMLVKPDDSGGPSMSICQLKHISVELQDYSHEKRSLLAVQREYTSIETVDGIPCAKTMPSLRFHHLQRACEAALTPSLTIWSLAHALFDEYDTSVLEFASDELKRYINDRERRQRLSDWLAREVVASSTKDKEAAASSKDPFGELFALMSGNRLVEAVDCAMDQKNFRLATLIGQSSTDEEAKASIKQQLDVWRDLKVESHIEPHLRKIFYLLSGETGLIPGMHAPDPKSSTQDMHIAEGLDWKRAFGLQLWYAISANETIESALSLYEEAYSSDARTSRPRPAHFDSPVSSGDCKWATDGDQRERTDIAYEMIKLYCEPAQPLEQTILPLNMSRSPFDSVVGWQIQQIMRSALQMRRFHDPLSADRLTITVAAILEQSGNIYWACFLLLHLSDLRAIEKAVKDLQIRNVKELATDASLLHALEYDLKVPRAWTAYALAIHSRLVSDTRQEIEYLIQCGSYEEAHEAILLQLAPEHVLDGSLDQLEDYLSRLEDIGVKDWQKGGQIYQIFVKMTKSPEMADGEMIRAFLRTLSILIVPKTLIGKAVLSYMANRASSWLREIEPDNTLLPVGLSNQEMLALERKRAVGILRKGLA